MFQERVAQLEKKLGECQRLLNATQKHVKELEIELDTVVRDRVGEALAIATIILDYCTNQLYM